MTEQARTELRDKIAALLEDRYTCTRVWEAWRHRTMTEDDFVPASEDEELIEDLAAAIDGPAHSSDDQALCPCRSCEHYELVNARAKLAELRAMAMAHDAGRGGCVCQLCTAMGLGNVAREEMAERLFSAAGLDDWGVANDAERAEWLELADKALGHLARPRVIQQ